MAIAHVQSTSDYPATAITLNSVTAGNCLILFISSTGEDTPSDETVADDNGNDWNSLTTLYEGNSHCWVWYAMNCNAGNTEVTVTDPYADCGLSLHEYSGIATSSAFDDEAGDINSGSTSFSSGNISTDTNDELLFGAWYSEVSDYAPVSEGTWTERTDEGGHVHLTADKIVSSTGSYAYEGTQTSNVHSGYYIAGFRAAAAAPPAGGSTAMNIGGHWKNVSGAVVVQINVGGHWKDASAMQININDQWKDVTIS